MYLLEASTRPRSALGLHHVEVLLPFDGFLLAQLVRVAVFFGDGLWSLAIPPGLSCDVLWDKSVLTDLFLQILL